MPKLHEAAIINSSITGIHYTYLLANIVGSVLCKKYNFDKNLYEQFVKDSTPKLCEGAYRNIWSGLASDKNYSDVNDDIHAMEMLVCKMKNSNAYNLIFNNNVAQLKLNSILTNYWNKVSEGELKDE